MAIIKKIDEVFGTSTMEEQRPSLKKITKKRLLLYPSVQHVNNVYVLDTCNYLCMSCYLIIITQHVTKVALWFLIHLSNNGNRLPGRPHAILLPVSTEPLRLAM